MQRIAITVRPNGRLGIVEQQDAMLWLLPWGEHGLWKERAQGRRVSPVEHLLEQTQGHIAEQDAWLSACGRLQHVLDDPAALFVIDQLVESRTAHRRVLVQMATSLRDSLYWTESEGALPCPQPRAVAPQAGHGLQRVTELIRAERELARTSRQLAGAYRDIACGLNALLLRTMALDSEKHDRVLRFVQRLLKSQVGKADGNDNDRTNEPVDGRILMQGAKLVRESVRVPEAAPTQVTHS